MRSGKINVWYMRKSLKKKIEEKQMGIAILKGNELDSSNEVNQIMSLLSDYAGFRISGFLENKLNTVFRNASSNELREWIRQIENDVEKNDLVSLVEDLCNHETYFFRDKEQLDLLVENIIPQIIKKNIKQGKTSFNIWSAACATGEEPYTLAMLFVNELIKMNLAHLCCATGEIKLNDGYSVSVLGTDISRQAIRIAREGTYQLECLDSFRQFPEEYLKYFTNIEENNGGVSVSSYRKINDSIKKLVNFKQFNLMSNEPPMIGFDIVLCRNVLIYIDKEKQGSLQTMLGNSIKEGGCLMLSPVDTLYCSGMFNLKYHNDWLIYEKK